MIHERKKLDLTTLLTELTYKDKSENQLDCGIFVMLQKQQSTFQLQLGGDKQTVQLHKLDTFEMDKSKKTNSFVRFMLDLISFMLDLISSIILKSWQLMSLPVIPHEVPNLVFTTTRNC